MTPPEMPKQAAGHRLGRDRHRVRQLLQRLGADVTVVEMMDRIVPVEDADVSAFLEKALKKQGMKILTGPGSKHRERQATASKRRSRARTARSSPAIPTATSSSPSASSRIREHRAGSAGRRKPTSAISRPTASGRTNVKGVWAIGDITAAPGWRTRPATKA
jgi:dihydrolipoamide dehydrogenase